MTTCHDKTALIAVSRSGVDQAIRLANVWPKATLCLPPRWPHNGDVFILDAPLKEHLPALWQKYNKLIFFLAAGAVVRLIAPLLGSKFDDPAVVVVDGAGQFAISLLAGHLGGANQLAREVAAALGATPVITTASDGDGLFAVDLLGQQQGWRLEATPLVLRQAAAALVNGDAMALILEGPWQEHLPSLPSWVTLLTSPAQIDLTDYATVLWVTHRSTASIESIKTPATLVIYRPPDLVLGVGCDRGTSEQTIAMAIELALKGHGYDWNNVHSVATIHLKGDEAGLLAVVQERNLPLRLFSTEALKDVTTPNPSEVVRRHMGVASVAEAAALLASSSDQLVITKQCYRGTDGRNVTVAAARMTHE